MARFFALPVLATVLALVGLRHLAAPAPADEPSPIMVSLPVQEPEAPAPAPQEKQEPAPAPPPPPSKTAPKPEPIIIILESLPTPAAEPASAPAPVVRTEIIERPIQVTQTTIVNNYYPVVEPAPAPVQEGVEVPVAVFVCPVHRRSNCCVPPVRRALRTQDTFFKTIPFQPPVPRGPRFNP